MSNQCCVACDYRSVRKCMRSLLLTFVSVTLMQWAAVQWCKLWASDDVWICWHRSFSKTSSTSFFPQGCHLFLFCLLHLCFSSSCFSSSSFFLILSSFLSSYLSSSFIYTVNFCHKDRNYAKNLPIFQRKWFLGLSFISRQKMILLRHIRWAFLLV